LGGDTALITVDEILAEVEKRMGALDERTKQAVTLALQLAEQHGLPKWRGENPTWDEWQRMSKEERQAAMDELEQRNRVWLEWMRRTLQAEWLLVVDGKIVRYGASWNEYPSDDALEALIQQLGKVPLLFAADPLIEETAWSPTRCTPKSLIVILTAADGTQKTASQTILYVRNWQQSPFVAVNTNRTALIGRSLCLATQAKILLDFAQQVTSVQG
jgi:hypothetical protein